MLKKKKIIQFPLEKQQEIQFSGWDLKQEKILVEHIVSLSVLSMFGSHSEIKSTTQSNWKREKITCNFFITFPPFIYFK